MLGSEGLERYRKPLFHCEREVLHRASPTEISTGRFFVARKLWKHPETLGKRVDIPMQEVRIQVAEGANCRPGAAQAFNQLVFL